MSRIRSCDSPPPFCGGISCSGDQSEDKRCNIHCCGKNSGLKKPNEFIRRGGWRLECLVRRRPLQRYLWRGKAEEDTDLQQSDTFLWGKPLFWAINSTRPLQHFLLW